MIDYSFIIPHKNSSVLLERLLLSIPKRLDIEVIVVDDHSSSDELQAVKQLASRYDFCLLENEGMYAGGARNTGLRRARGEWLVFADADDFFLPTLPAMLEQYKHSGADLVLFNADSCYSDTLEPSTRAEHIHHIFHQYMSKQNFRAIACRQLAPWAKFVRRRFVEDNNIVYEEIIAANDLAFNVRIACLASTIIANPTPLYMLTATSGSITTVQTKERHLSRLESTIRANRVLRQQGYRRYQMSVLYYIASALQFGIKYELQVLWRILMTGTNPFIGTSKLLRAGREWNRLHDKRVIQK